MNYIFRVFYRGCKYSLDVFKVKYDLAFTVRSLIPSWFDDWDPNIEDVKRVLDAGIILPLRGKLNCYSLFSQGD